MVVEEAVATITGPYADEQRPQPPFYSPNFYLGMVSQQVRREVLDILERTTFSFTHCRKFLGFYYRYRYTDLWRGLRRLDINMERIDLLRLFGIKMLVYKHGYSFQSFDATYDNYFTQISGGLLQLKKLRIHIPCVSHGFPSAHSWICQRAFLKVFKAGIIGRLFRIKRVHFRGCIPHRAIQHLARQIARERGGNLPTQNALITRRIQTLLYWYVRNSD